MVAVEDVEIVVEEGGRSGSLKVEVKVVVVMEIEVQVEVEV